MYQDATGDAAEQGVVGPQIRAARALLGWRLGALARESGVHEATVYRAERVSGVPITRSGNLVKIRRALERAGVEFLDHGSGAGVRLRG